MDAKKLFGLAVIVFLGFWMFTDPNGLADTAKTAAVAGADGLGSLFTAIIDFVGSFS